MNNKSKLYRPLRSKKRRHKAKRLARIKEVLGIESFGMLAFYSHELSPEMHMTNWELAT